MIGRFITLEGGEGSGKTTQSKLLCQWLNERGVRALHTREPGGSIGAELIRELLIGAAEAEWDALTEVLLFTAARRDHVHKTILPALERGEWVVCDRFYDSTVAYQAYGSTLSRDITDALHHLAMGSFQPDITLILDLPVELGLSRAKSVTGSDVDRFEARDIEFHEKLREGFLDIARKHANRCCIIDAAQDIDKISAAIVFALKKRFAI